MSRRALDAQQLRSSPKLARGARQHNMCTAESTVSKLPGRAAEKITQLQAAERPIAGKALHVGGLLPLADAGLGIVVVRPPLLVLQLLPHAATTAPSGRRSSGTVAAVSLLCTGEESREVLRIRGHSGFGVKYGTPRTATMCV